MSLESRTALSAAANTVAGIQVLPYFTQTTKAGAGWVRLDRIDYPNAFGGVCYWQVIVLLPSDQAAAEKYIDAHNSALVEALSGEMIIRSSSPVTLNLSTGSLSALVLEGTREEN